MRRVPCPICAGNDGEGCDNCGGVGTVTETPTVFRTFPDGEVVALFAAVPADPVGRCSSYVHVGQHGAADYWQVVGRTRPASPDEYQDLMDELIRIGYALRVVRRASRMMHEERKAELRRLLGSHVAVSADARGRRPPFCRGGRRQAGVRRIGPATEEGTPCRSR